MAIKTSIKIKKFWFADVAADGGVGTNWEQVQIGQREASVQFNGSDADVSNYKNVLGAVLESALSKGDKTMNFQLADLTPEVIAAFTGGVVTDDVDASTYVAPINENQSIEKSVKFLTEKNVLFVIPRCSFDGYPIINDDDLHYYQMNSVALQPEKESLSAYSMAILKLPSANDIVSFSMVEESAPAVITPGANTVAITVVALTDPSALVATIGVSLGAAIVPASGIEVDYTLPVDFVVEAADGTLATWTATVTVTP